MIGGPHRLRASTLLAALLVIAIGCPAAAMSLPAQHVEITQQLFGLDGNPTLVANFVPDGSLATPSWAVCPPGAPACQPAGVTNQLFAPGPAPAGTAFEASAFYAGAASTARSGPWLGGVAPTASPTLTGTAKVGGRVIPHGGAWTGGWGGEFDVLHVEACRTASGRGCTTIAHPWVLRGASGAAAIDPRWSGRYLFAFDQRYARGTAFPAIGYLSPTAIPPTPAGPTVARSAPLGPVTGPALALRDHPLLQRDSRLLLGRVTCARGCRVTVRVSADGADFGASVPVRGTQRLTVPALDARLDGQLTIRIRVGSAPLVSTVVPPHGVVAARVP